jgi:hypothetical protein
MTPRLPFEDFMPAPERVTVSKNMEFRFEVFKNKRMKYITIGLWKQTPEKNWNLVAGEITAPLHIVNEVIQVLMHISQSYASKPFRPMRLEALPDIREARITPYYSSKEN